MSGRGLLARPVRTAALVVAFVAVFLTLGLPRWLSRDNGPTTTHATVSFTKLCRDHGGTPTTTHGPGPGAADQPLCTVRYGGRVYRADAVTPDGFDEDAAHFNRQGCEEAARQQKTLPASRRQTFVYHADTGVCERRAS